MASLVQHSYWSACAEYPDGAYSTGSLLYHPTDGNNLYRTYTNKKPSAGPDDPF